MNSKEFRRLAIKHFSNDDGDEFGYQSRCAVAFAVHPSTISRWCNGKKCNIPGPAARLMEALENERSKTHGP
jgi:hypothetical protein